jgi:serine/threonine protein kinase
MDLLSPLIMGTLNYLAPEVFTKKITSLKDYDTLSDMWSLGVIIYTLVG